MSGPYENNGDPGQVEREYKKCTYCFGKGRVTGDQLYNDEGVALLVFTEKKCQKCQGFGTVEADNEPDEFKYRFETSKTK